MAKIAKINISDKIPSLDTALTGAHEPFAQFLFSKDFLVKQSPEKLIYFMIYIPQFLIF